MFFNLKYIFNFQLFHQLLYLNHQTIIAILEFKGELPEGQHMKVENKNFYFDIGQNSRGIYMRISEVIFYLFIHPCLFLFYFFHLFHLPFKIVMITFCVFENVNAICVYICIFVTILNIEKLLYVANKYLVDLLHAVSVVISHYIKPDCK